MTQRLEPGQRVRLNPMMGVHDKITGREVVEGVVDSVNGGDVIVSVEVSGKVQCHRYPEEMTIQPPTPTKPIPLAAAKRIADDYGYHQVVIMARVTGEVEGSDEHITTYGINVQHCRVAAMMGDKLKEVAQWPGVDATTQKIADLEAVIAAQADEINNLKIEILERVERDADYRGDAWERDIKS
jgi:hypothetical protein